MRRKKIDVDRVLTLWKQGLSTTVIQERLGVTGDAVRYALKVAGVSNDGKRRGYWGSAGGDAGWRSSAKLSR